MTKKLSDRIIVALDFSDRDRVQKLVRELKSVVGAFKVGKQLFTALGPEIVRWIQDEGARVFLDLKFHDIPHTVALACESATQMGVFMLTLHTMGSQKMMMEAVQSCSKMDSKTKPLLLGVTVLTSLSQKEITHEWGCVHSLEKQVLFLAKLAQKSGLNGVVCSPHEIKMIRETCGKDFLIVTPGVRFQDQDRGDQLRVATPSEALKKGADWIVMGRSVTQSSSPRTVLKTFYEQEMTL